MRFVAVDELKPGMIVGRKILNRTRSAMVEKGITLSEKKIAHLIKNGYLGAYIVDDFSETVQIQETVNEKTFENVKGINVNFFAFFMFWIAVIIAILAAVAVVRLLISRKLTSGDGKDTRAGIYFLTAFIAVSMISYYKLAAELPFVCTMNFRYIIALVPVSCTLIGVWCERDLIASPKIRKGALVSLYTCFILFAFCTTVFMGAVGFT